MIKVGAATKAEREEKKARVDFGLRMVYDVSYNTAKREEHDVEGSWHQN